MTDVAQIPRGCGCGVGWQLQLQFDPWPGNLQKTDRQTDRKKESILHLLRELNSLSERASLGNSIKLKKEVTPILYKLFQNMEGKGTFHNAF